MNKLFKNYAGLKVAILMVLVAAFFVMATLTVQPQKAEAICCSSCCVCLSTIVTDLADWVQDWIQINLYIFIQLQIHQILWFDFEFWQMHMLPAFMQMGIQLAAVGTEQVMAIGMFIDAKEQLETQRLLQELHAKANKDYHPSIGMCEFGTRIKSLAASERKGEMNALILSERSLDRLLGNKSTGAAGGSKEDIKIRLGSFQTKFCNKFDNNSSLDVLCPVLAASTSPDPWVTNRYNKDIDYQRTIEDPWTLRSLKLNTPNQGSLVGFDLTDSGEATEADEEIFAMADNLYGYAGFDRADYKKLKNTARDATDLQMAYLEMRATVAKTNVAQNSFNALVALKGDGSLGSKEFTVAYLEELGVSSSEIDKYLGVNPSYYAQMEILTKKAYQSPMFYTNLYDKPANVARKGVAMQAIGLIQKFDLLKSYLRTEASLSILLELSVEQLQREIEDNIQAYGK